MKQVRSIIYHWLGVGFTFIATLLFASCAGSPIAVSSLDANQLQKENTENLCGAYQYSRKPLIKMELMSRKIINDADWIYIDQNKVRIGMKEISVLCSWGAPTVINETISSTGINKQFVYRRCDSCSAQYIYTRNGIVTTIQN